MPETLLDRFAALHRTRWRVAERTPRQRIDALRALRASLLRHRPALLEALAQDLGRPPAETEILELQPLVLELDHAIRHLPRWMAPARVKTPWVLAGTRAEIRYEPRGVVLILAPWNYPVNLALAPLVAAVAAGNCVVLKPSEKVPRTAGAIAALVADACPGDEVTCVLGGPEIAEQLLALPFDHIFFTGSGGKGRAVLHAAAEHLASTTLELGGKSPALVLEDADLALAAERIVWGKFVNAGQTCIAPDYVLVQASRAEAFVRQAVDSVQRRYAAADGQPPRDLCCLVDAVAWERQRRLLDDAVRGGARIATGGRLWPDERRIAPTILTGVPPDSPLLRDEIFGPLLPVVAVADLETAIDRLRAGPAPLALYVFSRRQATFDRLVRQTAAGGAVWNHVVLHFGNPNLPFGGHLGAYHGWFGFRTFSRERAVLRQGRVSLTHLFYPPYGERVDRRLGWLRWLMRTRRR